MKKLLRAALFISILLSAEFAARYAMSDDRYAISRFMLHEMYTGGEDIDELFIGASHVQLAFDTGLLDELLDGETFNAGSSMQSLGTSYALLKEIGAHHRLKRVYVDLDPSMLLSDDVSLESIFAISDYMRPSFRKLGYLLDVTPEGNLMNTLMPFGKGRSYRKEPAAVMENLRYKLSGDYLQYREPDGSYAGKGYIASRVSLPGDSFGTGGSFSPLSGRITERNLAYLEKIIRYCREEGAELSFVVVPMSDFLLLGEGNYDSYAAELREALAGSGVPLYDFNLMRPEYLDLQEQRYYSDMEHLNREGAERFAAAFAALVRGDVPAEDMFFDSYGEKMREKTENGNRSYYGVVLQSQENGFRLVPVAACPEEEKARIRYRVRYDAEADGDYITAELDGTILGESFVRAEEIGGENRLLGEEGAEP